MDKLDLGEEVYALLGATPPVLVDWLSSESLDGLWYWDISGSEQGWFSPSFLALVGLTEPPSDPGEWWRTSIHPDDHDEAIRQYQAHLEDRANRFDHTARWLTPSGDIVWLRSRCIALDDQQGAPSRWLGTHTDLTALKQAELEAQEKNVALQKQNEALDEYAYVVAHDLKEPLRNIVGLIDLMHDGHVDQLDDNGERLLGMIQQSATRMARMVGDLHELATLGEGSVKRVDLDEMVTEVLFDHGVGGAQCDRLPTVLANHAQMRQLWSNVIANAVKFSGDNPRIEISYRPTKAGHQFKVRDHGPGIKGDPKRLFRLFSRGAGDDVPGTGLGLALCKRIVELHGGQITIANAKNGPAAVVYFSLATT